MSVFIGCELPLPHVNVLNRRVATREERLAGRCCHECLRSQWPRRSLTPAERRKQPSMESKPGRLRCTLFNDGASEREVCDAFEGAPFQ